MQEEERKEEGDIPDIHGLDCLVIVLYRSKVQAVLIIALFWRRGGEEGGKRIFKVLAVWTALPASHMSKDSG